MEIHREGDRATLIANVRVYRGNEKVLDIVIKDGKESMGYTLHGEEIKKLIEEARKAV